VVKSGGINEDELSILPSDRKFGFIDGGHAVTR
jgi:hypothetical protein